MVLWEEFSALLPIYNLYPRINCQIRLSVTASLCNFSFNRNKQDKRRTNTKFLDISGLFFSFSWYFTKQGCSAGFDCQKEAFMLIICFESNVRHVANNVPKGTPSYRMGLSCLIQQLKALDEVIHPPRLWHLLLMKRARTEGRQRQNYERKKFY